MSCVEGTVREGDTHYPAAVTRESENMAQQRVDLGRVLGEVNAAILLHGIRQRREHVSRRGTYRVECELCVRARVRRGLVAVDLYPPRELL